MKNLFAIVTMCMLMAACTPKTTPKVTETKPTPTENKPSALDVNIKSSPDCPTFRSSGKEDAAMEAHVIYRDFVRNKKYDEAFEYWQTAYEIAPAADGKRNYHFADGIKIYEHFYKNETDAAKKKTHLAKIEELYDAMANCYGDVGYVAGKKAFDYYYTYPGIKSEDEVYEMFKKSIDTDGKKANYFIVNPFTALLVNRIIEGKTTQAEGQKYAKKINEVIDYGVKNAKTAKEKKPWDIILSYAPARLESLEGIKGFYDCEYFANKYYKDFEAAQDDCDVAETTFGRLRWGGCPATDARLAKMKPVVDKCNPPVVSTGSSSSGGSDYNKGLKALRDGNYTEAVSKMQSAIDGSSSNEDKSKYAFLISKIYYAHLKKYSKAREYANKAANWRSGWGEPYILIGKLYASSGPLCGPGTGWDSQVVTWPAIDMWNKAKSVDPSVASEASKLIRKYQKYMPSKEDMFLRGVKTGDSYKVPCWIGATTKARPAVE